MKGKLTLFVALSFLMVQSYAQHGTLSGKVVDGKSGETLIGASVIVDDNATIGAATDLDGNFTIPKVPAGVHKVRVNYIGYQPKEPTWFLPACDSFSTLSTFSSAH